LGFAGFLDQPPNEVCDPANWEAWMHDMKFDVADTATPLNRSETLENARNIG